MIKRMMDEDYFKMPGVSNSYLSRLAKCPANALIPLEQTPAMALGSALHCLALEGMEEFNKRFAVSPLCDKRTTVGKACFAEFEATVGNKTIVTLEQLQTISGMAESIATHPTASQLIQGGQVETAFTWEEDGVECKGKADYFTSSCLIDLKSTSDASERKFSRSVTDFLYHNQFAFYRSGLASNGVFPSNFLIIAVESKPPYPCAVYELDDDMLSWGEAGYKHLLARHKACVEAQSFPAYTNAGIITLRPPSWVSEYLE